ncbi:MAG TPA: hypothetical protein VGZ52_01930 [Acidimicrobiales bacterium]|nr:hypothetical protein [Acidimicrobiales bacterium]
MRVQQLESTDGFLLFDLDGAERAVGIARLAPKVLRDSAEMLARSVTYSFASFELRIGGASAGINAKPDERDAALAKFVDEVSPLTADGALTLHAGTGLDDADLAPLGGEPPDPTLLVHGALAAATAVHGSLDGVTLAVVGIGPIAESAKVAASDRGASVVDDVGVDASADVLLIAGKAGMLDHEAAASVKATTIAPLTPLPVTAKAYAALARTGIVYVPDFIALAAPLLAEFDPTSVSEPVDRIRDAMQSLASEGANAWRAAVDRAEAFLATWHEPLPFGRPLAS